MAERVRDESPLEGTQTPGRRTPAHVYLILSGLYLTVIGGIMGLIANHSFALGSAVRTDPKNSGRVLGIFVSNGWHSLIGLLGGLLALGLLASSRRIARSGSIWLGVYYLSVTVSLLIRPTTNAASNIIATNGADNWTHFALGIGGIVAGFATQVAAGSGPSRFSGRRLRAYPSRSAH